jgi:GT2 family glycosyltransferase
MMSSSMHIVVSFCNLRTAKLPSLGLLDPEPLELRFLKLPDEVGHGGITGLASSAHDLYLVVQATHNSGSPDLAGRSVLFVLDGRDLALRTRYELRSAADVHSLCLVDDALYAVSTGTDEVIRLRLRGSEVVSEECYWCPHIGGPREDGHHMNAVLERDGDILVAGFGKKESGSWSSARNGFIMNVARNAELAAGIEQPHSLLGFRDQIVFCESRRMAVRVVGDSRHQYLPGYTRGLCAVDDELFVGTSMGRQMSKSTGAINNPGDQGVLGGHCTISRLRSDDFMVLETLTLDEYGSEIYDLLPVENAARWPTLSEIDWRGKAIRELAAVLDQRSCQNRRLSEEVSQCNSLIGQLRKRCDDVAAIRKSVEGHPRQLETIRSTIALLLETLSHGFDRSCADVKKRLEYERLVHRIRHVVGDVVPADAKVAVVSKGDEELLKLGGRDVCHFPLSENGAYAGYHPGCGLAAIAHLEVLRARGIQYLLIPATSLWWLDSYPDFKAHLEARYHRLFCEQDLCALYCLDARDDRNDRACGETFVEVVARFRSAFGRDPSVLDWLSGQQLCQRYPDLPILAPPSNDGRLPYVDQSIDFVAVASGAPEVLSEARRVAATGVIECSVGAKPEPRITVTWLQEAPLRPLATVSIVIPVCNHWRHTAACLRAVQATIPRHLRCEILVIDDASTDETPARLAEVAASDDRIRVLRNETNRGFVDSCNRGAEAAGGEVLIFLNNDTVALPGWLSALLETFEQFPEAGAVGGKLLFADGRLQEAGGIIFRDASAAHFGRGEPDATRPLFDYVREVDYCSGALLATPRNLFRELGGFDLAYQPAYYEDADYCFRLRCAGRPVYYQPESVVVHLEGVSSGSDPSSGMKQYQLINRTKFLQRWKEVLENDHFERPAQFDEETWYLLARRGKESATQ